MTVDGSVDVQPPEAGQGQQPRPPRKRNRGGQTKHGLSCGQLPAGSSYIRQLSHQLKRGLEQAVIDAKGELSIVDTATINTATRAERLSLLAARWLRMEAERLSPADRLNFAREVVKASETRDRCIRSLGLDAKSIAQFQQDRMMAQLYGPQPGSPAWPPEPAPAEHADAGPPSGTTQPPDASAGQVGDGEHSGRT